jgi:hypothetical protein
MGTSAAPGRAGAARSGPGATPASAAPPRGLPTVHRTIPVELKGDRCRAAGPWAAGRFIPLGPRATPSPLERLDAVSAASLWRLCGSASRLGALQSYTWAAQGLLGSLQSYTWAAQGLHCSLQSYTWAAQGLH